MSEQPTMQPWSGPNKWCPKCESGDYKSHHRGEYVFPGPGIVEGEPKMISEFMEIICVCGWRWKEQPADSNNDE